MISKEPSARKRKPGSEKSGKAKTTASSAAESDGPIDHSKMLHQLIAERAYQLFEHRTTRGPMDDWLEAEREILGLNGVATH
jgi:Protein of unknown function (DUF2934)